MVARTTEALELVTRALELQPDEPAILDSMGWVLFRNGQYEESVQYLTRAYGRWVGFFFGWAQLTVILSGSVGSMAYAFADYASGLFRCDSSWIPWIAAVVVLVLTASNLAGLVAGKWTQNVLVVFKILGLGGLVVAGFVAMLTLGPSDVAPPATSDASANFGLAVVFVMYAYGGWNDAAFVAAGGADAAEKARGADGTLGAGDGDGGAERARLPDLRQYRHDRGGGGLSQPDVRADPVQGDD